MLSFLVFALKILLGIGNELNGDDGIGCFIARRFKQSGWLSIEASTVPENYLGKIIKEKPELVVIVDAAHMGLDAGEIRIIKKEIAYSTFVTTHTFPLNELISAMEKYAKKVLLIGIQPKQTDYMRGLSREVKAASKKLLEILRTEGFEKLNQF